MTSLTLVSHRLCPYVQRAAIALAEKGVAFERVMVDLDHKPGWFAELSPLGKVPLLKVRQDDGSEAVLFESGAICEYIDEAFPSPALLAGDPLQRARLRAWMEFGSAVLADMWGIETATDAAAHQRHVDALGAKFARVEAALGAGPHFLGEPFSMIDAFFAPVLRYFDVFDSLTDTGVFERTPKLRAWRTVLAQRPSVRAAVDTDYAERLLAFLRQRNAHIVAGA
jgi:glutathione S-transferase